MGVEAQLGARGAGGAGPYGIDLWEGAGGDACGARRPGPAAGAGAHPLAEPTGAAGSGRVTGTPGAGVRSGTPFGGVPAGPPAGRCRHTDLPGDVLAPAAARRFVRAALADWAGHGAPDGEPITAQLVDDAVLLVSELVTNAVVHAGTGVVVRCALEPAGAPEPRATLYAEVTDHHPARPVRGRPAVPEPAPGGPRRTPEPFGPAEPPASTVSAGLTEPPASTVSAGPAEPPAPAASPGPAEPPGRSVSPGSAGPPRATEPPGSWQPPGSWRALGSGEPAMPAGRGGASTAVAGGDRAGSGLRLVGTIADSWGTTYRRSSKSVWFRLPVAPAVDDGAPAPAPGAGGRTPRTDLRIAEVLAPAPYRPIRHRGAVGWPSHGALSFLAEASDLLAGQFDEDKLALLAGQLLVPRLADWCAVWLQAPGAEPAAPWVWHASEGRVAELRHLVGDEPPRLSAAARGRAVACPWPGGPSAYGPGGAALACGLVTGGHVVGTLLIGRAGLTRIPEEVARLFEDFARRVALAVASARQYTRQAQISEVLQRGLLPNGLAAIPGMDAAVVYEPTGGTSAGGDFYDVFPAGDGRWCFALGDVCGNGPEAAVVTGLARPVLRLLAREGYGVTDVLDRLNRTLGEQAVEAAACAVAAEGPGESRFLSLLYGELVPYGARPEDGGDGTVDPWRTGAAPGPADGGDRAGADGHGAGGERAVRGGVRCTLASAGHPLPLLLRADGTVAERARPQLLLGVLDEVQYESETFDLLAGETLVCVTDGVTERRSDREQFDDDGGLARVLSACGGLTAQEVAQRLRAAVHAFAASPPDDDLAMLVLRAAP